MKNANKNLDHDVSILSNTIESMLSDAEDAGKASFGLVLSIDDARVINKALILFGNTLENEFGETVSGMLSPLYKERFRAEYAQTKIRYERLKAFNNKIEAANRTSWYQENKEQRVTVVANPPHDCPDELLREQQGAMGEYLHLLEIRAVIEGIDLGTP